MNTAYCLSGILPVKQLLGVYGSYNEAYDALQAYFNTSLDEDGAGKFHYQYETYLIESREVGLPADRQKQIWYVEYDADYAAGTCKEALDDVSKRC